MTIPALFLPVILPGCHKPGTQSMNFVVKLESNFPRQQLISIMAIVIVFGKIFLPRALTQLGPSLGSARVPIVR